MKQTINLNQFVDAFNQMGRGNHFSQAGYVALFDYLEEYEESTGEEIEFDVIGLCGEFSEYPSLEEFHKEYDKEDYPTLEVLEEHTQVIRVGEGFIIQVF